MLTFKETGLKPELLESIEKLGFTHPTPIQSEAIPFILESDKDLIAMAQTGTGKTAAFGLPILHKMDPNNKGIQAIVLCPTRELCLQITSDIKTYTTHLNFSVVPVYGGAPIFDQINAIKRKCEIVVGTPGRVNDMIRRGKLDLTSIKFLVLDEADEMLKMGFKDEMDAILEQTPETKQTLLFSATIPPDINRMAGKYMHTPTTISVSKKNISNADISHEYCTTTHSNGYQALRRIADITPEIYGIIFCRTRQETKDIADKLMGDGYNADALHGDLSQAQRDYVMGRFRNKHLQLLVATDVAARGLDVDHLTHVIHFHLPDDPENYIHRSGRTGRAGNKGISIAILSPSEQRRISFIEKQTGQKFVMRPIPSGQEVFKKRLESYLMNVVATEPKGFDVDNFEEIILEQLGELTREEIIEKFIALNFNRLHSDYQNAPDLNVTPGSSGRRERGSDRGERTRDRSSRGRNERGSDRERGASRSFGGNRGFSRYSINIGAKNDMRPDVLISLINRQTPDLKIAIGKIDIQQKVSIFEADGEHENNLIKAFQKARYKGMPVTIHTMQSERPEKRGGDFSKGGSSRKPNFPRRKRI